MTLYAKDIMVTDFDRIHEDSPVDQAIVMILNGRIRSTGHKTVSLVVVDDFGHLTGVITMFDILYHLRPTFLNYGISGDDMPWTGRLDKLVEDIKGKKVKEVMSETVVGASLNEHVMALLDRMIKHKYRRLPVLQDYRPIGIVYISDLYHHIFAGRI